ncbi:transposase [Mesorhizobium sp. PL10]
MQGHQEGRFFHGYYNCYCYLPLYIFCGRHLLAAKLRRSNIDASKGAIEEVERIVRQIRRQWRRVRIVLRADSGFAREELMTWCEANGVDYVFLPATSGWRRRSLQPCRKLTWHPGKRPGRARIPRLHVVNERQLVTPTADRRRGRGRRRAPIRASS